MAPRNRGKGKTGGKQKKKKIVAENEVEEKYRKAALEVDILKEHLALWRDVARQAKADGEGLKRRLLELELELELERTTRRIFMKMIRQHQELQRQTETRMQQLETETKQLQEQLATCHQATQRAQEEGEQLRGEKDRPISELRGRIDAMETEYEKILHLFFTRCFSVLPLQGSLDREGRHRHAHGVQREAERVRTQSPGDLGP
uniref:Dynein regulatory complex protein 12 n=1 Tax=Pelodiscus sinensis TaxID=13735 RepID=K7G1J3_PELSI